MESATCCGMESHLGEYGIDAKYCMESRTKGNGEYRLSADAMRGRAAIPSNSLRELMPYQACGLDKTKQFFLLFYRCMFVLIYKLYDRVCKIKQEATMMGASLKNES